MSLRPVDVGELQFIEFDLFAARIDALAKKKEG